VAPGGALVAKFLVLPGPGVPGVPVGVRPRLGVDRGQNSSRYRLIRLSAPHENHTPLKIRHGAVLLDRSNAFLVPRVAV
jgi:hypothetical protein